MHNTYNVIMLHPTAGREPRPGMMNDVNHLQEKRVGLVWDTFFVYQTYISSQMTDNVFCFGNLSLLFDLLFPVQDFCFSRGVARR